MGVVPGLTTLSTSCDRLAPHPPIIAQNFLVVSSQIANLIMDAEVPSAKRAKMDGEDAYIPTQEHTDGQPTFSVIFSLREEKGALARALKPFEVKSRR